MFKRINVFKKINNNDQVPETQLLFSNRTQHTSVGSKNHLAR